MGREDEGAGGVRLNQNYSDLMLTRSNHVRSFLEKMRESTGEGKGK